MRKYFGHGHIRTLISVFGKLFSQIYIAKHSGDGTSIDRLVQIPIRYRPMSHLYMPKGDSTDKSENKRLKRFMEYFPRLSYEFTGLTYNPTVQRAQINRRKNPNNTEQIGYTPAPYRLNFVLHIISKEQPSAIQILEQILPFFRPNVSISIKHETFDETERDVILNLDAVDLEDSFEDLETKRIVHYTLAFTMTTDFWGAVSNTDIAIADYAKEGGTIEVDKSVTDSIGTDPNLEDNGSLSIIPDASGVIQKIIIDLHDMNILDTEDHHWPVMERTSIEPVPVNASDLSEMIGTSSKTSFPTDIDTERKPPK